MRGLDPERFKETWFLLFLMGVLMLNYPFIHIFNKETMIFGIPALLFYFLLGWPLSIFVVFLFSRHLNDHEDKPGRNKKGRK